MDGFHITDIPQRITKLPTDKRGYPVPWFVAWIDGEPDFRVIGPRKIATAVNERKCWICGETLGTYLAFVIGPMCAINRLGSEPPSHRECARFASRACPFMINPSMKRNERKKPEEAEPAAGMPILRNPGVTLIWITKNYYPMRVDRGVLFRVGDPITLEWFCEGREATRLEIMDSIESGLPILRDMAERQGPAAEKQLQRQVEQALNLVPER